ncbi:glycosyltransferase [Marinimicrobium alkaliphilum]|uniref:glycosyltransferase n=1 Tax=Marinimicrobium alkaliphilum TaxID=2202654 RepID=UPI000DB922AB|nr:glycosyltransferase [Marinimicrobium alkaliphilum]
MSQHPGSILHLIDTTGPGGAETVFTQLAAHTHREGYRTLAIIRGPGWVRDELERLNIETRIINCKGSFNLTFLRELIRTIRQERACLIQAHLLGSSVYASLAGLLTRTPVISTFHGHVDVSPKERLRWAKFLIIQLGSKKVIAVTQKLATMLNNVKTLSVRRITTIPNGIDTDHFEQAPPAPLRETYGIPATALVIGCLGNVRPAKNYTLAIDTLKQLTDDGADAYLLIAGDDTNTLAQSVKAHVESLGMSDRVRWLGFYGDNAGYLKGLDVFLLTSSSEGHPLALTQAMAAGTPIVSTASGVEEIVSHGKEALIDHTHTARALAEQILTLTGNDAERSSLVDQAKHLASERYSQRAMIAAYDSLYREHQRLRPKHTKAAQFIIDRFGSKRALLTTVNLTLTDVFTRRYDRYKQIPDAIGRVVFVCKGNICRSAAAEAVFRASSDIPTASVGLDTQTGHPADPRINRIANAAGLDMSHHRTTAARDFQPQPGDLYICMEPRHLPLLQEQLGDVPAVLLGTITKPTRLYIHDPYSSSDAYAQRCTQSITARTKQLAQQLEAHTASRSHSRATG